jgi:hypothetical protein
MLSGTLQFINRAQSESARLLTSQTDGNSLDLIEKKNKENKQTDSFS